VTVPPPDRDAALRRIRERLEPLRGLADGVVAREAAGADHILVLKRGDQVLLYFGTPREDGRGMDFSGVMSRVAIGDPMYLLGLYTRVMMLVLAWCPRPRDVCVIGFGGGRIPMVLRHHVPGVVVHGTESEPAVARLAQQYFGIEVDERLTVAVEDGREYLRRRDMRYDVIAVDCFGSAGHHPYHLSTVEFYALCRSRLRPGGVVTTNLSVIDPLLPAKIATFGAAFRSAYGYDAAGACVLFGSADTDPDPATLRQAAREAERRYGFSFPMAEYAAGLAPLAADPEAALLTDAPG
jgi:spermidine synthase